MKVIYDHEEKSNVSSNFLLSSVKSYLLKNKKIKKIYFSKLLAKEKELMIKLNNLKKDTDGYKKNFSETNMKYAEIKMRNDKTIDTLINSISY